MWWGVPSPPTASRRRAGGGGRVSHRRYCTASSRQRQHTRGRFIALRASTAAPPAEASWDAQALTPAVPVTPGGCQHDPWVKYSVNRTKNTNTGLTVSAQALRAHASESTHAAPGSNSLCPPALAFAARSGAPCGGRGISCSAVLYGSVGARGRNCETLQSEEHPHEVREMLCTRS